MTLEDLKDLFSYAVQADLEHGVAWMNAEAAARFAKDYPELNRALKVLMDLESVAS